MIYDLMYHISSWDKNLNELLCNLAEVRKEVDIAKALVRLAAGREYKKFKERVQICRLYRMLLKITGSGKSLNNG